MPCHLPTIVLLSTLLRKLDSQDQMPKTVPIHLLARSCGVAAIRVRHKCKTLGPTRFAVFGEEDASDPAVALEHFAKIGFFGKFGDLPGTD